MKKRFNKCSNSYKEREFQGEHWRSALSQRLAFTLIELLVVMAVIGVLVMLAVPRLIGYSQRAQHTRDIHTVKVVETALEAYLIQGGAFPEGFGVVDSIQLSDAARNGSILGAEGYVFTIDDVTYYELTYEFLKSIDVRLHSDARTNEFIIQAQAKSSPSAIYASTRGKALMNKDEALIGYPSSDQETPVTEEPGAVAGPGAEGCTLGVTSPTYLTYVEHPGGIEITGLSEAGDSLTELNIPSTIDGIAVTGISEDAFRGGSLTSVCIPSSVSSLGDNAFRENPNLSTLLLEGNISNNYTITSHPFVGTDLRTVIFGDSVRRIPNSMFRGAKITSIDLNNVTSIGISAFHSNALTSLDLKNVTNVGGYAFSYNALTSLDLKNVTSIGGYAFSHNALTSIDLKSTSHMDSGVFAYNRISSLDLGILTIVPHLAFKSNELTHLDMKNVTYVGYGAFDDNALTSLDLRNVDEIREKAFYNNQLTNIDLMNVTKLESEAFGANLSLTRVVMRRDVESNYEEYHQPFASSGVREVVFESGVTRIPDHMFRNLLIKSLDMNNVDVVGSYAFYRNDLAYVNLRSVTNIGASAFERNYILQGAAISSLLSSQVTIGAEAFEYNGQLGYTPITPVFQAE